MSAIVNIVRLPNKIEDKIKKENIFPIDPERSGGLHPLGKLNLLMVGIFFIIISLYSLCEWLTGIFLYSNVVRNQFVFFVIILLSICILIFIYPQLKIHNKMVEIKRDYMREVLKEYMELNETKEKDIQTKILIEQRKLATLAFFNEIEKMREYPIDVSTLKTIIGLALMPLLINLIGFILQRFIF